MNDHLDTEARPAPPTQRGTFLSRIGGFFRRSRPTELPVMREISDDGDDPSRTSFIRPTPRRDQAMGQLADGVGALANLMTAIRDSLEAQAERQERVLGYLAHLPEALSRLPEGQRQHAESLAAIQRHLETQNQHQQALTDILAQIRQGGAHQAGALEALRQRIESLGTNDAAIGQMLQNVGDSMAGFSTTASASTEVLQKLHTNISARDGELETILRQQNTRFTTLLSVAIFLSIGALTAVAVIGYLLLTR